ncbi:hypothetical protein KM043_006737 [Ampulex compressa]|nr:hypothetical protein KM043_006737 [Ampulex compressa]
MSRRGKNAMGRTRMKKAPSNMKMETDPIYINEILRDYQQRSKNVFKEMELIPDDKPNQVGMEKMNAKSAFGSTSNIKYTSINAIQLFLEKEFVKPCINIHDTHEGFYLRFLVVVFILVALGALIALSFIFWDRYQNSAIVINLNTNRYFFTIDKPAYLICALTSVDESKFPKVFERYSIRDTEETRKFFEFLSNVDYENMNSTPGFEEVDPALWLRILYDLRTDFPSSVLQISDIDETWVVTERGMCLAVRGYSSVYANPEYWFADNWTVVPPPDIIPYFNYTNTRAEMETISLKLEIAVAPYHPGDIITYETPMRLIPARVLDHTNLMMSDVTTMEQVKDLSVHQRTCKYPDDKGLKMWPIYSYGMCVRECRMDLIEKHCNCYPHFSRSIGSVPVCNVKQLRCIGEIRDKLFLHEKAPTFCRCLPNCDTVDYIVEDYVRSIMPLGGIENVSIFRANIEFPLVKINRAVLFGFIDFLAAVGGAAGLFLGASVLSFAEIMFYATLHLCIYIGRVHKQRKKARSRLKR